MNSELEMLIILKTLIPPCDILHTFMDPRPGIWLGPSVNETVSLMSFSTHVLVYKEATGYVCWFGILLSVCIYLF